MGEVQKHGFVFEKKIIKLLKCEKSCNYTDIYDGYDKDNDNNLQIKMMKENSELCLGDTLRNQQKKDDFTLIIGIWGDNNKYKVKKFYSLKIDYRKWNDLSKFDNIKECIKEFKTISGDKKDDYRFKHLKQKYTNEWDNNNKIFSLRFRRDHTGQSRLQTVVTKKNFLKFTNHFKKDDRYEIELEDINYAIENRSPSPFRNVKKKKCRDGKILNPVSKRCVDINSKIGKDIIKKQQVKSVSLVVKSVSPVVKSVSPVVKSTLGLAELTSMFSKIKLSGNKNKTERLLPIPKNLSPDTRQT